MLIFPPPFPKITAQMRLEKFLGGQNERILVLPDVYYRGDSPTTVRVGPKEADGVKIRIDDQSTGFSAMVRGWFWMVGGEIRDSGPNNTWISSILAAADDADTEK